MQWQVSYIMFIGTAVALLGFLKWPRSSYELIHPRFVVPGIIWLATFGQALVRNPEEWRAQFYDAARIEFGNQALWYTILAMLCFYIGLLLPLGRWFSDPFMRVEGRFKLNMPLLRKIGWIGTWSLMGLFILLAGPRAIGVSSVGSLIPMNEGIFHLATIVFSVGSVFNAAMLGISWPEKEQRNVLTYIGMAVGLLVNSMYTMPIFSRGAGLAVFVAAMAYSIRVKRFRLSVMIPAILWVALCANTGLYGRALYGRQSDVPTYLSTLFRYSLFDPINVFRTGFGLNDSFTALAMSMKAITRVNVGQMSKIDWIIYQLPLPHWFRFMPEWTVDLTIYIGGQGTWGYTTGMLGDTYIHWSWFGVLWFILIGVVYRFVSSLVFRPMSEGHDSVSAFSMVLFTGYYAIGMGVFNTFRAWVVSFTFPALIICAFLILRSLLFAPENETSGQYPQDLPLHHLPPHPGARNVM